MSFFNTNGYSIPGRNVYYLEVFPIIFTNILIIYNDNEIVYLNLEPSPEDIKISMLNISHESELPVTFIIAEYIIGMTPYDVDVACNYPVCTTAVITDLAFQNIEVKIELERSFITFEHALIHCPEFIGFYSVCKSEQARKEFIEFFFKNYKGYNSYL